MSDAYRDLVEGLRALPEPPADGGEATRRRILRDLAPPKRRKRGRLALVLIAASIAFSTAFALYIASVGHEREPPAARRTHRSPAAVATTPAQPVDRLPDHSLAAPAGPEVESSGRNVEAPSSDRKVRARRGAAQEALSVTARERAPAAVTPSDAAPIAVPEAPAQGSAADGRMLYATAHRLQFRGTPQRALEAWDAFLASAPPEPFLREARYNRAIILLRLGRHAEAKDALTPFARGEYQGFRQSEASELLRSLPP